MSICRHTHQIHGVHVLQGKQIKTTIVTHIPIKTIILKVFTREDNLRSGFRFTLPAGGILFTKPKKNRAGSQVLEETGIQFDTEPCFA